jgi:hypothetical protein
MEMENNMKKTGIDYSRFDHIDTDSDEEGGNNASGGNVDPSAVAVSSSSSASNVAFNSSKPELVPTIPSVSQPEMKTKKGKEGRFKFEYEGRTIYEWEQSLEEVNIYLEPPPGVSRHLIAINIGHTHLTVGLQNTPPFIDEDTGTLILVLRRIVLTYTDRLSVCC